MLNFPHEQVCFTRACFLHANSGWPSEHATSSLVVSLINYSPILCGAQCGVLWTTNCSTWDFCTLSDGWDHVTLTNNVTTTKGKTKHTFPYCNLREEEEHFYHLFTFHLLFWYRYIKEMLKVNRWWLFFCVLHCTVKEDSA